MGCDQSLLSVIPWVVDISCQLKSNMQRCPSGWWWNSCSSTMRVEESSELVASIRMSCVSKRWQTDRQVGWKKQFNCHFPHVLCQKVLWLINAYWAKAVLFTSLTNPEDCASFECWWVCGRLSESRLLESIQLLKVKLLPTYMNQVGGKKTLSSWEISSLVKRREEGITYIIKRTHDY